jgi:hypothetical protein
MDQRSPAQPVDREPVTINEVGDSSFTHAEELGHLFTRVQQSVSVHKILSVT